MARLSPENVELAQQIIARYPRPKSATIPLCHLAQEQDGYLADDAMAHIAELVGCTSAEVLGTASFYEMFKRHETGKFCLNVCTNISCQLLGGEELLEHAEQVLGVRSGGTTDDGLITLEDVECIAACTEAPACLVNYRFQHKVTNESFDELIDDIRAGNRSDIPPHGTLAKVRQRIEPGQVANITPPEQQAEPVWFAARNAAAQGDAS
ncbi:MAG: NADH-quinone oxidoreductase subunit NuoE [Actinobacteria bacterium]|nr:NADH-quinone oxidoreductase subunit NuoE [Actinomycetota bacterium]